MASTAQPKFGEEVKEQTFVIEGSDRNQTKLTITGYSTQGARPYMEDRMKISHCTGPDGITRCIFFGVYDGHGGEEAAEYSSTRLHEAIIEQTGFYSKNDTEVLGSIKDAFLQVHEEMNQVKSAWNGKIFQDEASAGTTASCLIIRNGKIYVAHVGDSRIVLGYVTGDVEYWDWKHEDLTKDHTPKDPQERERIAKAGGKTKACAGGHRVCFKRVTTNAQGEPITEEFPRLNVSRSLGDFWSLVDATKEYAVSPIPDLDCIKLDPKLCKTLIIASDGVWTVMPSNVAVNLAKRYREESPWESEPSPAKLICKTATKWNSAPDNITAIVVLLEPVKEADPASVDPAFNDSATNLGSTKSLIREKLSVDTTTVDRNLDPNQDEEEMAWYLRYHLQLLATPVVPEVTNNNSVKQETEPKTNKIGDDGTGDTVGKESSSEGMEVRTDVQRNTEGPQEFSDEYLDSLIMDPNVAIHPVILEEILSNATFMY